ncbi:MAG: ArsA-related P-loop ATPase [Deltaproteobacteria bacterium]
MADTLASPLSRARCVVCVGPGGVGKTSTSAAIAMQGAAAGRRTCVLTIDPARRLANALGMPQIGNVERDVDAAAFEAVGLPPPKGRMTAMMLDIKQTWDDVVTRYHPDPAKKKKLLESRMYVTMSTALAGSQEYMAMEKLYELSCRDEDPLDLIVLDTPPSNHAMDFLEAPSRMLNALDNDATRWLLEPALNKKRTSRKLFDAGSSFFLRTISRFTGAELLQELAELLAGFSGMFDGFRERAKAVRKILEADDTTFFVISTPNTSGVDAAGQFHERLTSHGIHVGAAVLNRATPDPFGGEPCPALDALEAAVVAEGGTADLAARLHREAELTRDRAVAHVEARTSLDNRLDVPVVLIPQLPRDVHDLLGLEQLRRHLFGESSTD